LNICGEKGKNYGLLLSSIIFSFSDKFNYFTKMAEVKAEEAPNTSLEDENETEESVYSEPNGEFMSQN
jgi:hypothetical protein